MLPALNSRQISGVEMKYKERNHHRRMDAEMRCGCENNCGGNDNKYVNYHSVE